MKLSVIRPRFTKESATMALDRSAIADLLDALRAGGDLDIIRFKAGPAGDSTTTGIGHAELARRTGAP